MRFVKLVGSIGFFLSFLIFLLPSSEAVVGVPFSHDGAVSLDVSFKTPRVLRSEGDTALFSYRFYGSDTSWFVEVCPKNYASLIGNNPSRKNRLKNVPITELAGVVHSQIPLVDLSQNRCVTVPFSAESRGKLRVGSASTIIEVGNGTVRFSVTPENTTCDQLSCVSSIVIQNTDNVSFTFLSTDLSMQFPTDRSTVQMFIGDRDASENFSIELLSGESVEYEILTTYSVPFVTEKYNVTFQGSIIDPVFQYSNNNIDSISIAALNETFFASGWCDESTNEAKLSFYTTEGVQYGSTVIVDDDIGTCHKEGKTVSVAAFNQSTVVVGWFDAADANVSVATYDVGTGAELGMVISDSNVGTLGKGVDVAVLNSTSFVLAWVDAGTSDERVRYILYDSDLNELVGSTQVSNNDIGSGQDVRVEALNSTSFVIGWHDKSDNSVRVETYVDNVVGLSEYKVDSNSGFWSSLDIGVFNRTDFVVAWLDRENVSYAVLDTSGNVLVSQTVVGVTSISNQEVEVGMVNSSSFGLVFGDDSPQGEYVGVYSHSGGVLASLRSYNDQDSGGIDFFGRDNNLGIGFCAENVTLAGADDTNSAFFSTNTSLLEAWDGSCSVSTGNLAPVITDVNASPNPVPQQILANITANVTDADSSISFVFATINSTNYSLSLSSGDVYSVLVNVSAFALGLHNVTVFANDSLGNSSSLVGENVLNVSAAQCVENWVADSNSCVNLQQVVSYTDIAGCGTNNSLPLDNGTVVSCSVFDCEPNLNIPFKRRMEWICSFPESSLPNTHNCVSTVSKGSVFIQKNPHPVFIDGYGVVSTFKETNDFMNVYFDTENLRRGQTYNFSVSCSSTNLSEADGVFVVETTPKNIVPVFYADRFIWLTSNAAYVISSVLILVFLIGGFLFVKRSVVGRRFS